MGLGGRTGPNLNTTNLGGSSQYLVVAYNSLSRTESVLVRASIAVMKHYDQSNLGRKGFVWLTLPHHCSSLKEVRTGTQGRNKEAGADAEAMERGCLLACTACFSIEPRITSPGVAPSTMAWALPHQSLTKSVPYRLAYSPILWRHFLN